MKVATEATTLADEHYSDAVVKQFWELNPITRAMAKRPVMTYVYGSTLSSTMDYVSLDLAAAGKEPIKTDAGVLAYSLNQLAVPIAKALRQGVVSTVPKAAEMMDYLQKLTRKHKEHVMQWVTPVGVPVVNWAEGQVVKLVKIKYGC